MTFRHSQSHHGFAVIDTFYPYLQDRLGENKLVNLIEDWDILEEYVGENLLAERFKTKVLMLLLQLQPNAPTPVAPYTNPNNTK